MAGCTDCIWALGNCTVKMLYLEPKRLSENCLPRSPILPILCQTVKLFLLLLLRNNMMVGFANGLRQASADAILALHIVYAELAPTQ